MKLYFYDIGTFITKISVVINGMICFKMFDVEKIKKCIKYSVLDRLLSKFNK